MKSLYKKSLAIITTLCLLSGLFTLTAYAEGEDAPMPALDPSVAAGTNKFTNPFSNKAEHCVDPEGTDKGYIITILEEAFETNTSPEDPKATYKTRVCVRNNYQIKDKATGEITNFSELLKTCSQSAKEEAAKTNPDYDIRFGCKEVLVILSKGGTSMIYGYIGMIYRWAARLVGLIAVLVIVLSGMQLAAAGGDQEAVNSAKKRIIQSFSGIAILFLSSLILNTINPTFYIISP